MEYWVRLHETSNSCWHILKASFHLSSLYILFSALSHFYFRQRSGRGLSLAFSTLMHFLVLHLTAIFYTLCKRLLQLGILKEVVNVIWLLCFQQYSHWFQLIGSYNSFLPNVNSLLSESSQIPSGHLGRRKTIWSLSFFIRTELEERSYVPTKNLRNRRKLLIVLG